MKIIAGVDEAGRGPLAGPVVAAAVILDMDKPIEGLNDSKKLSEKKRLYFFNEIKEKALAWSICEASVDEIDQINILHASMLAMKRAVESLQPAPELVLVDGNRNPDIDIQCRAIVGGDALEQAISAASILAKVSRDQKMMEYHQLFPRYGFDRHKGYPTKLHLDMLRTFGPSDIHRKSFAPVQQAGLFG
jgi:ribonuclease HII